MASHQHGHHGNSIAAWTAVGTILVGLVLAAIDLMVSDGVTVLFWIGMILLPIGLILGIALSKLGYGVDG